VPGYLNNAAIAETLDKLTLRPGVDKLTENLRVCYEQLVRMELVGHEELGLIEAWAADLQEIS